MVVHVLEPRDLDLEKFCFQCKGLGHLATSEPCGHCHGPGFDRLQPNNPGRDRPARAVRDRAGEG
jgi:hypothetical protein